MNDNFPLKGLETLSRPERLKVLTEQAGAADPGRRIFGSKKTDYKYAPVLEISAVHDFEVRTRITLPEEYVRFLTEVGNGGAGVDYGMYSLEDAERNNYIEDARSEGLTLFDREDPAKFYVETAKEIERLDSKFGKDAQELIDRLNRDIIRGMFVIGTAGCTYDYFIMLSGRKKGMVGQIDWNLMGDHRDVPRVYDLGLFDFLEDHFRRIILGRYISRGSFDSVEYRSDTGFKSRTPFVLPEEPKKQVQPAPPPPQPGPAPSITPPPPPPRHGPQRRAKGVGGDGYIISYYFLKNVRFTVTKRRIVRFI